MTETTMTAVMDRLVAGARASRDSTVNTFDALERQTRAASDALAARVRSFITEHPADPATTAALRPSATLPARDARFDPEEWEVTGPQEPSPRPSPPPSEDTDDDYPETWLR